MATSARWSRWSPFPDPTNHGILAAPFGPGVYELRRSDDRRRILCGQSKNVAVRMGSLLPPPLGQGNRNNRDKSRYVHRHLEQVHYRTRATKSVAEAKQIERLMRSTHVYIFVT